ncbi:MULTISPECIES: hypothetical protein [Streptomyces]|uniref:hypothetical protein n=1 Tax=Streptomyces TaxID=1883 RepID=UPI00167CC766|nr:MULTISPECIES: hypothetical protein [Streptomyces]GHD74636.1 hypothetical protein GCM10010317_088170 [Streptomyces mirabilis]
MSCHWWLVRRAPALALLLAVCALFLGACHDGHDFVPDGGTVVAPAGHHHERGGAGGVRWSASD